MFYSCLDQKGLNSVKVYADEQLCHTISGINKDLIVNVTCDNPVRGQTIKLQKRGQSFLNFCEVEVWGRIYHISIPSLEPTNRQSNRPTIYPLP